MRQHLACLSVKAADALGCPRPVSIQNQFSLLYWPFEGQLAEACAPSHYDISLLPWTPLGGGMLSEKYIAADGKVLPENQVSEGLKVRHVRLLDGTHEAGQGEGSD